MVANERKIVALFSQSNTQFIIPVYQREYNWQEKHCKLLLNDIMVLSKDMEKTSHFIGSIVYIHEGVYRTGINEFNIIDGQQRITTLTLLFLAICHTFNKLGSLKMLKKTFNRYIIDEYMDRDLKFKLIPPEENFNLLEKIANEKYDELENFQDRNMIKNYKLFLESLKDFSENDLEDLLVGIDKLIYVDIALEKGKDDPQKIFESLNSTGLDLSQSDLIRNFILMDLERAEQNRIYKEIWIPLENNCKISDGIKINSYVSDFIRDYLTLKNNKIPNKAKVFEEFKDFYSKNIEVLEEIKRYSEIYSVILKPEDEKEKELRQKLKYIKALDQSVINPFLMGLIKDYREKHLEKKTLLDILDLLESYIWRRYVTGEPSNALNKIFMNLYSKLRNDEYYDSFAEVILKQKFPTDEELKYDLKIKPIYKDREKINYVFEKLENYYHNELIDFDNDKITIEHIFPQNPGENWKSYLKKEEFEQMLSLKDTISNLTLTGSNSNLGNRTFSEKRDDVQHGYKNSKLYLNRWLGMQNEWNILKMDERFENLFKDILQVWHRPDVELVYVRENLIFFIKGPRSSGSGELKGNNFAVLKGSYASKEQMPGAGSSNLKQIERLLELGVLKEEVDRYIFETDCIFSSPSAAAKFVLGRSANGWTEWKTFEGKLLNDFRN
ncbi:MAG: DUF4357 domain-containing protein [Leptotrichiaceae bacterium]|nr:DUF4357 domain-containing protein [Leptotrichiaceae bacterium]